MAEIVIKAENLCFEYEEQESGNGFPVLRGVDLEIERGSFVAVLGHNGSGKSTLAKLINLLLTPTSGKLWLFGQEVDEKKMSEDELFALRRRIGMVFQNPDNQLVATIVEEDVAFGPENLGVEPSEIRRRVDESLAMVGMSEFARHSPHQLSGGQKQRVAIAGIIALSPEIILFDESTAMLDPMGRAEVLAIMKKLNRENGTTILHITHYMEEAILADRILVLDDGKLILDGTPKEVFSHFDLVRAAGLDVPQVTELAGALRIPGTPITPEEAADAISEALKTRKGKTL